MFASRTQWKLTQNRLAAALENARRQGVPLIDLTESNPTRCGFRYPGEEIIKALSRPGALHYAPSPQGLPEAREAVAGYYRRQGASVHADQIFLTASTSEAYSFLFRLLADPGDRVLIPRPSYPLFELLSGLNDVKADSYSLQYEAGWHIDFHSLTRAHHARTRAIVLVNPNNPTGSFLKEDELLELNPWCQKKKSALISDEVFCDYAYQPASKRVATLAGNTPVLTFTLGGISKALGLPQMKLAWIAVSGPPKLVKSAAERLEMIADTYLSVNTPAQQALPALLELRPAIQAGILARLKENLSFLLAGLSAHPGAEYLPAEGGWYAVLRIPRTQSEEEWCLEFLRKDRVYVHPGYFFDFEKEAYLILSLLPPPSVFQEGVRRILARIEKS